MPVFKFKVSLTTAGKIMKNGEIPHCTLAMFRNM
jgi:hypothetical protein